MTTDELLAMCTATAHAMALRIADEAVVEFIRGESFCGSAAGWLDLRPLLDEQEHPPESIDHTLEWLAYATERRLIERHPRLTHMVRIIHPSA
jgi:hypothetical protein